MTLYANTSTHGASAGGKPHASESFETTPFRPRTQEPLALIRAVKNQQETLLEASQKHRGERVPTGDRLDATKTFPNSHAPPLMSSPYRRPTAGEAIQHKYDSLQSQPGWQAHTAASALQTRAMNNTRGPVPTLDFTKTLNFDPSTQRRCLTERAQLGWSINQRPMSKRLEHRLREKFNKVDGSSGLATEPNRTAEGGNRWARLDYKWKEGDRAKHGSSVPVHCASIVKTHHATREFRSDSMFSPTRRPDDIFGATRTRGNHNIQGGVPFQETTASQIGNFFGGLEIERPCTSGTRVNPWNYHWQIGPSTLQTARH